MLTPIPGQKLPTPGSSKPIAFMCSCGKEVVKPWKYYASGKVKSCGKCSWMGLEYWASMKYGKLRMKVPAEVPPSSHKKVLWLCDCGKETEVSISQVTSGNTSSCGKCSEISADEISTIKFGKLRMKEPKSVQPGSHEKTEWLCDCGRTVLAYINNVVRGKSKSCGKCNILSAEHFSSTKYGRLRMKDPEDSMPGSEKLAVWLCDCGKEIKTKICYVISGNTRSCGKCRTSALEWYNKNTEAIRSLKVPINPDQIPPGFLTVSETIESTRKPFKAVCGVCRSEYHPNWDNTRSGKSLSCGCCSSRVSKGQSEVAEFIESIGFQTKTEYVVGGYRFDIAVESKKLLVEYHGLIWHSGSGKHQKDMNKKRVAAQTGWSLVSLFEDEWETDRSKVETILRNRLGVSSLKSVRPSACTIKMLPSSEADSFYEKFHYIGKAKASINYAVFFEEKLVACASFKRPTRQSMHDWELVRMASSSDVRIHGIWSKILRKFVSEYSPDSVVSFSDNRLFDGGVYERIGFKLDGDVPPDYYWCKGQRRFHKSGLRKTSEEKKLGLTESQLREAEGYRRIWDLGKKRWVFRPEAQPTMAASVPH